MESIFKKTLDRAPPRLKRIILEVQQYALNVIYVPCKDIPIPDALCRDIENENVSHEAEEI